MAVFHFLLLFPFAAFPPAPRCWRSKTCATPWWSIFSGSTRSSLCPPASPAHLPRRPPTLNTSEVTFWSSCQCQKKRSYYIFLKKQKKLILKTGAELLVWTTAWPCCLNTCAAAASEPPGKWLVDSGVLFAPATLLLLMEVALTSAVRLTAGHVDEKAPSCCCLCLQSCALHLLLRRGCRRQRFSSRADAEKKT